MLPGAAFALATLSYALPSRAQEPDIALRAHVSIGSAAASCVEARELGDRVDDILGRDAVSDDGELHVVVDARPSDRGSTLFITLSDAGGVRAEREVAHDSAECGALIGTLSVVVAMMLDDRAREVALDITRAVPTITATAPVPPLAPPTAAGARAWIGFGAGVVVALGLLPGAVPGAELRGEVGVTGIGSGALALVVFPWGTARGAPGGEFTGLSGSLSGCTPRSVDLAPFSIAGCAGVSGGAIRGVATSVERAIERLEPVVALDAYADLALTVARPLGIALRLGLSVPVVRPSFFARIGGARAQIHEPWPVVPMATLAFFLVDRE
jgi:hypothetical protein